MNTSPHTINWFEIPTTQLGRAVDFYRAVTGLPMKVASFGGGEMAVFPGEPGSIYGALIRNDHLAPGPGTIVYLNTAAFEGGLAGGLARAAAAGGTIVMPATDIGQHGTIALFKDSEGNTVGLHAPAL